MIETETPAPGASSALRAGAAEGMGSVEPAAWDELCGPGQAPLRHDYVRAWEHGRLPGLRSRPVVVRDSENRLAAAAPAHFYDLDAAVAPSRFADKGLRLIRRAIPRALVIRTFEVGSPTPLVPPFLRSGRLSRRRSARAIVEASLAEADAGGAEMTLVQNFEERPDPEDEEALREAGFDRVPIPPTVLVHLPFADFDEYLGSMRSHYRRRARKTIEASAHLHVRHIPDFAEQAPELARLWRLVYDRAEELQREILGEEFFRAAAAVDVVSVLALCREDGSLASYALLLDDRPRLHFLYTGFERASGEREAAYFRLLYEIVRHAIEHGYSSVNLGMTTLAPKFDVGGVPVPLHAWLRHRNPLVHRAYVALARGPFAPGPVEPRNVFKS
ncbi:MAG: GNAT family N-acetyltransferase [Gaiellaceae bacterium]